MSRRLLLFFLYVTTRGVLAFLGALEICHDDFNLKPEDGVLPRNTFNWLGFVQYIHASTGLHHQTKAPRVVLIQKQFVLGTAKDLMTPPKNYNLGNVVFGEYERDEEECALSRSQVQLGATCPPAYIEIPIKDVTPHPEYSRFGVGNSLALVKLIRPMISRYMVPVCMPSISERHKVNKKKNVFMVDYLSSVPQDFDSERMGKRTLKLYTHKDCKTHRLKHGLRNADVTHLLCTSGCGVRPGAPIISHNAEGGFELFGIAAGGAPCKHKAMRRRLVKEPPLYIDVYPYITWMMNVVTANTVPSPYPQNLRQLVGGSSLAFRASEEFLRKRKRQRTGWKGRTFLTGNYCFKSNYRQSKSLRFFYMEQFDVIVPPPTKLNVHMKISAGIECAVMCARLLLPTGVTGTPEILGIGAYNISVKFSTDGFPYRFSYSLGLSGRNATKNEVMRWFQEPVLGFW